MDIQGNFYRCPQCSRVTQGYPLGCRTSNCPVKKDVMNDIVYGTFLSLIIVVATVLGIAYLFHYASIHSTYAPINKKVDFPVERRYTK